MLLIYQLSQTVIRDLLLTEAFIIPPNADSYLPNQPYIQDPYFRNLLGKALASSSTYL